jgi:hypothetical protein
VRCPLGRPGIYVAKTPVAPFDDLAELGPSLCGLPTWMATGRLLELLVRLCGVLLELSMYVTKGGGGVER